MSEPEAAPETLDDEEQLLRSPRFRWALALWVLNYVFGWPVIALSASASVWIGTSNAAMLGGVSYALSWLMLGVAMLLGGSEIAVYGKRWIRGRRRVERD